MISGFYNDSGSPNSKDKKKKKRKLNRQQNVETTNKTKYVLYNMYWTNIKNIHTDKYNITKPDWKLRSKSKYYNNKEKMVKK